MKKTTVVALSVAWGLGIAALLSGCATLSPLVGVAFKDGGSIVSCGANEKAMVDTALADGKVNTGAAVIDWLSFVAYNLECVAPVVGDIYRAYKSAKPVAHAAAPNWRAPIYNAYPSQVKMRRAHVAFMLCKQAGVCK